MKYIYFLTLIFGLIITDYATKLWIIEYLAYGQGFVVGEYLNIVRVHNTGAAFGFLSGYGGWQLWLLSGLALGVSGAMIYWLMTKPLNIILSFAFILISAGALGNSLDRLLYGFVVDFIDFHYQNWHYPAFNVADIAISCGAVLLIIDMFVNRSK